MVLGYGRIDHKIIMAVPSLHNAIKDRHYSPALPSGHNYNNFIGTMFKIE